MRPPITTRSARSSGSRLPTTATVLSTRCRESPTASGVVVGQVESGHTRSLPASLARGEAVTQAGSGSCLGVPQPPIRTRPRPTQAVAPVRMASAVRQPLRGQLSGVFAHEFQKPRHLEDVPPAEPDRVSAGTLDDREVAQQLHGPVVLETDLQPD